MQSLARRSLLVALALPAVARPALAHGPTRQRASEAVDIARSPDEVWATIRNFESIARWHPLVASSPADKGNEVGSKRMLTLRAPGGPGFEEELAKYDAAGRVSVANVQSGDVSVLDAATLTEARRLKVGAFPYAVGVMPDGGRILVTNQHDGTVSLFDGGTYAALGVVSVGEYPEGIAVSADGARRPAG